MLAVLGDDGPSSQASLGRGADLDRSDVAAAVDALEERGAVRRSPDPADRRRNVVQLTPAGRRLLVRADAAIGQAQADLLAPLPAVDRDRFVALLARVAG